MKNLTQKFFLAVTGFWLLGLTTFSANAFTSMYVFGDALSTTTNNASASSYPKDYYGNRYSNGRVWVEVLAQRQGIGISNNWSYFDCNSANLWTNVQHFAISPSAASSALFVVWVNNSDLYDEAMNGNTNIVEWTSVINRAQTNQFRAITNLYAKGVRTLIMPSAVDLSEVPGFAMNYQRVFLQFVRQECIAYNNAFAGTLDRARAACPGLKIYEPNFFWLLDDVLSRASFYGLTNALQNGVPVDAMDALWPNCNTNGLGTNYVYWDYLDPSARFHAIIADFAQQIISPVQIAQITPLGNGSNQLAIVNVPVGLTGYIEGCTNLASPNWTTLQSIGGVAPAQSYFVPTPVPTSQDSKFVSKDITPPGPGGTVVVTALEFYRLNYPYQWVWP